MTEKLDIITIGESLVELSSDKSLLHAEQLDKFYGGDTLCTAIAASKLGAQVGYICRVGNDSFREYLMDSWQHAGLDISQVKLIEGTNGLYVIARSEEDGTREFAYYRKKTAGCSLNRDDISEEYLKQGKIFYTTGIVQGLSLCAKDAVKKAYMLSKQNGLITAYRPNYVPKLHTIEDAKENFYDIAEYLDILFLSIKHDARKIFEMESMDTLIKYFWDLGISTVIAKVADDNGYYTGYNGDVQFTKFFTDKIVDTTCSGDAFSGAYLHGINTGLSPMEATKLASIVEGLQSQKIGAIKSLPSKSEVYSIYKGCHE